MSVTCRNAHTYEHFIHMCVPTHAHTRTHTRSRRCRHMLLIVLARQVLAFLALSFSSHVLERGCGWGVRGREGTGKRQAVWREVNSAGDRWGEDTLHSGHQNSFLTSTIFANSSEPLRSHKIKCLVGDLIPIFLKGGAS